MKHINFIRTLSPQQQRNVHQWYRISLMLYGFAFILIATITIKQIYTLRQSYQEKKEITFAPQEFDRIMEQKQKLKQEEMELNKKIAFIASYTDAAKSPTAYITSLVKTSALQVASISVHEHGIELSAYCSNSQDISKLHKTLEESPHFNHLKLIGIQPHQHANKSLLRVNMKGNIT